MKLRFLILLVLLFCQQTHARGSDTITQKRPTIYEKLYLHVDRELYAPKDTIWFKSYLVSGIDHRLIRGFKNIYVELVSDSGRVVDTRLMLSTDGIAHGEFILPYFIEDGNYIIRAHTKYQQNFGEESYFHKRIMVSKTRPQRDHVRDSLAHAGIDVEFFPEGGNLVLNSSNMVAFKVVDKSGKSIDVTGSVVDDEGNLVTPFKTVFQGMGKFALMPSADRTYHVVIDGYPDFTYTFDDIRVNGVAFNFLDEGNTVSFAISRNYKSVEKRDFYLVASHKGISLFQELVETDGFYHVVRYSKGLFPLGISKITLLNDDMDILAERLIFVQVDQPDMVRITTNKDDYKTRSNVLMNLTAHLEEGDSLLSSLSVAVVNADYTTRKGYALDMRSYLLVDSELKGKIEAPSTFFTDEERISSGEKLDLLMMVQGWRSYYWDDIIENQDPELKGWKDAGLTVKGYVKRLFRDQPVPLGVVRLGPFSVDHMWELTQTDENGMFRFDRIYMEQGAEFIVQAETQNGTRLTEIMMDSLYTPPKSVPSVPLLQTVAPIEVPDDYFTENFYRLQAERKYAIESGSFWLDEVEVVRKDPRVFNVGDDTYGFPDRTLKITEDDWTYTNVFDYLEGRMPGVEVDGNSISIRGGMSPVFIVDGIIDDFNMVADIPMSDIDRIEVIKGGVGMAALGSQGADGAISIYTKRGKSDTEFQRYVRGRLIMKVNGYQRPAKFYNMQYNARTFSRPQPDFRPTLLWNPDVKLSNNQANFEFYTSDFITDYIVVVEGITKKGRFCTGLGKFSVTARN